MRSRNIAYLPGVDHLRALASVLIVLFHSDHFMRTTRLGGGPKPGQWVDVGNPFHALVVEGHTAVSLFIVLSGFIFTYGALGSDIRYGGFIRNRLLRIYPLFVFLIIVGTAVSPQEFEFTAFLQTLFGLANLDGALQLGSLSAMFWTVAIECQFYLVFPFLLAFANRAGARPLVAMALAVIVFRALGAAYGADMHQLSYSTLLARMDQFLIGMLGAMALRSLGERQSLLRWLFLPAAVGVLLLIDAFNAAGGWSSTATWKILWPTVEAIAWCVFMLSYLAIAPRIPAPLSRGLVAVGLVSYSVYLVHFPLLQLMVGRGWFLKPDWGFQGLVQLNAFAVFLPAILAVAWLTYTAIERPFLSLRSVYREPTEESEAA